jgi:hypothetical protein
MAHSIQDFKTALKGGGARPNLFEVVLTDFPGEAEAEFDATEFSVLCKAANLPASNIASIDVPFRGRVFKVAGDRTFDTWSITVINDEDFKIRTAMEAWMQYVGQYADGSGATNPNDYMRDVLVKQLKRLPSVVGGNNAVGTGLEVAKQYKFYSIFPTNISAIDLSYDTADTIEEFTVEFQVQYWTPYIGEN